MTDLLHEPLRRVRAVRGEEPVKARLSPMGRVRGVLKVAIGAGRWAGIAGVFRDAMRAYRETGTA